MSRRGVATLLGGAAALLVAWHLVPAAPPIYDGLAVPPSYRYSCPPAGQPGEPKGADKTVDATTTTQSGIIATSDEVDQAGTPSPQVQLLIGPASFAIPPGTNQVHVTITPSCPPAQPAPSKGTVVGNLYHIAAADSAGKPLALAPTRSVQLILRGPGDASTSIAIEQLGGGAWKKLDTTPVSTAQTFAAQQLDQLGDFALVDENPPRSTVAPAVSIAIYVYLAGGLLLLAAATIAWRRG